MTHDDDPIDFSPLDPARDAPRWDRAIDRVVARAVAARRPSPINQMIREVSRTGVFVFALAAAAAAAMWFGRQPGASQPVTRDPVTEWSRWANGEGVDPLSLIDSGGAR